MRQLGIELQGGVALPDGSACRVLVRLPGPTFVPGRYSINAFLGIPFLQHVDEISEALQFDVLPPVEPWRPYELHQSRGLLCRKAEWSCSDVMSRVAAAGQGTA